MATDGSLTSIITKGQTTGVRNLSVLNGKNVSYTASRFEEIPSGRILQHDRRKIYQRHVKTSEISIGNDDNRDNDFKRNNDDHLLDLDSKKRKNKVTDSAGNTKTKVLRKDKEEEEEEEEENEMFDIPELEPNDVLDKFSAAERRRLYSHEGIDPEYEPLGEDDMAKIRNASIAGIVDGDIVKGDALYVDAYEGVPPPPEETEENKKMLKQILASPRVKDMASKLRVTALTSKMTKDIVSGDTPLTAIMGKGFVDVAKIKSFWRGLKKSRRDGIFPGLEEAVVQMLKVDQQIRELMCFINPWFYMSQDEHKSIPRTIEEFIREIDINGVNHCETMVVSKDTKGIVFSTERFYHQVYTRDIVILTVLLTESNSNPNLYYYNHHYFSVFHNA